MFITNRLIITALSEITDKFHKPGRICVTDI